MSLEDGIQRKVKKRFRIIPNDGLYEIRDGKKKIVREIPRLLEEVYWHDGFLFDMYGNPLDAERIDQPFLLKYLSLWNSPLQKSIIENAPPRTNAYQLGTEIIPVRNSDYLVRIVQYWRITNRNNEDIDERTKEEDSRLEVDLGDFSLDYEKLPDFEIEPAVKSWGKMSRKKMR